MRHRDAVGMAVLVAVLAVLTIAVGERIGINGGLGWDGMGYALWAREFPHEVLEKGVTVYHAQRQLPPALVHYVLRTDDVIRGFQLLDAGCLVIAAYLWGRIGLVLAWSRPAAWAGFAAVFGSFAIARHALYYPTLTDATAFALGMAMAWAFLARRPIALWIVALAGAFTWPALPALALGLLVLRRDPLVGEPVRRPIAAVAAVLAALSACAVAVHYYRVPYPGDEKWLAHIPRDLLAVTLPVLAAWTCAAAYLLVRSSSGLAAYGKRLVAWRTLFAIAGIAVVYVLRALWIHRVATQGPGPTGEQFACELALESLRGPGWDLVHHVVYYGPIVLVAIGAWRSVTRVAASFGPGALLALAMVVAFAVGSESRQWLHLFPLLVALTIAATHEWWTPSRTVIFIALCLAWSKLWWPLRYDLPGSSFEWPALRYFMQQGPWASTETFLWHLCAAVATALVLLAMLRQKQSKK